MRAQRLTAKSVFIAGCSVLIVGCVFGDPAYSVRVVNECGRTVRFDYRDSGGIPLRTRPTSAAEEIRPGDDHLVKNAGAGGVPDRAEVLIVADGAAEGVILAAVFEPGSEGDRGTIVLDEECAAID